MNNTSRLSFAAKIVATAIFSLQTPSLYAAPVTTNDSCGDGCTRQIIKDTEAKTVRVDVSAVDQDKAHDSEIYSYEVGQFDHFEITNSANIDRRTGDSWRIGLFYTPESPVSKSIKIENNGRISGNSNAFTPEPPVYPSDVRSIYVSERFELKNNGTLDLSGGSYSAISVTGSDNTEYYIENNGKINFRSSGGVNITNGKTAKIYNRKGAVIDGYAYPLNVANIENVIIENEGIINGHIFRGPSTTEDGEIISNNLASLHVKSTGGMISGNVELYGSNNTIELENTDVSNLFEITAYGRQLSDKDNTVKINQEMRINTGFSERETKPYTRIDGMDKLVVGEKGKAILVEKIQFTENPLDGEDREKNAKLLTNNGVIALSPNSRNVDVRYELTENNGVIDLNDGSNEPAQTLTLHGNYAGSEGSVLRVDHRWNKANEEENDLLIIKGKASGKTRVEVRDTTVGDSIRNDVLSRGGWSKPLVIVEQGTDGKAVFEGVVDTQSAEQAYLTQRVDENGNVVFAWVLKYADSISGYAQAGVVNQDMGLEQLGRLHQRVGEQANGDPRLNSWGRTRITEGVVQGKKSLGVDSRRGLVQVGQDLAIKEYAAGYAHQGFMFSYSWADNQFFYRDPLKNTVDASGKLVGKGKSVMYSLGAYHTYYGKDSTYLDIVANLSWLENKYLGQKSLSQKGYSAALGAEIGRSYPLNHQWKIEPQAQLKMQYLVLDGMNDGKRKVEGSSHFTAQGRLGVRVTDGMLYASVNLVQELTPAKVISKIGQSKVEEHYNATLFDVSLGANMPLNKAKTLTLYGDLNYSRALDGSNRIFSHRNGRENYSAQVGIRFQW